MRAKLKFSTPKRSAPGVWACPCLILRWLLLSVSAQSLDWQAHENYRSAPLSPGPAHKPGFLLLTPEQTGIAFTNVVSQARYTTNQIFLNGSGVAAGDVDGDGLCDLYFCSLDGTNALFRNLGNWHFENITDKAGVACKGLPCTAAAFADLDGDGDLDLIVNTIGAGTHIFFNDGKGRFTEGPVLNPGRAGMSLAVADTDGKGALDLYIANYRTSTLRDQPQTDFRINMVNGKPVVAAVNGKPTTSPDLIGRFTLSATGQINEHGEPDALYHNDGHGSFLLLPFTGGTFVDEEGKPLPSPLYDWGLSCMFRDLNGDGAPDLYVCNDFQSVDRVWINDGHGHFHPIARLALRNTSKFSMGIDVADINRDGYDDIFVLDMLSRHHTTRLTRADKSMETTPIGVIDNRPQLTRNTLHLNRGDGTYAEIAYYAGLTASEWSWTPIFLDVDLDGYEDLLICTGHARDDMDLDNGLRIERTRHSHRMAPMDELALRLSSPSLPAPKLAFRNLGNLQFEETGERWGFNQIGISQAMCLADLDNDGDLDVVINNLNGAVGIYRNETSAPRVAVRLKGSAGNTRGIGSKIKLFGGAVPMQSQEMICGGRYLSSDDPIRVLAAGTLTNQMRLEVTWRSGKRSTISGVQANRVYEISESGAAESPAAAPEKLSPWFEDVSSLLRHEHHQEAYDDFARQPLLPNRLSQLGPGVAWFDLNGDGREDLVIGSGRGGHMAVFQNRGTNGFRELNQQPFTQKVTSDQTTILGFPVATGLTVLSGSANYQEDELSMAAVRQYNLANTNLQDTVGPQAASTGPLALGPIDTNGSLALFVGGRVSPGRYPEAASSSIFRFRGTTWQRDEENSTRLKDVGLVSAAVWTDLDGDGFPELVLACEWGPIRIFHNDHGHLKPWDPPITWRTNADVTLNSQLSTLSKLTGFWNGVSAGDFDGDGRLDLVASNWGLNSKYKTSAGRGRRIYYGPWGNNGQPEFLEAYFDPEMNRWVPERDLNVVGQAIPWVLQRFHSFRKYAEAGIEEILGEHLNEARILEVNWLETTVFLNRGDHFEVATLPPAAQFGPAFGINVADFDGDGNEDIFLSQNFFDVQAQTSRNDAGRGLLLKGNGHGAFEEVPGQLSGIQVYGEQRGSAVADYDNDGRVDLAVTQNGAATRLYHNLAAHPGLRVRLNAGPDNPQGVGAVLRLGFGEAWGPAREVHAGSGYCSEDSALQVMALPRPATRIEVQWPGGAKTVSAIPSQAREIAVDRSGAVKVSP